MSASEHANDVMQTMKMRKKPLKHATAHSIGACTLRIYAARASYQTVLLKCRLAVPNDSCYVLSEYHSVRLQHSSPFTRMFVIAAQWFPFTSRLPHLALPDPVVSLRK